MRGLRANSFASHGSGTVRERAIDVITVPAQITNSRLKVRLPFLVILPSRSFPPEECWLGTKPI